MRFLAIWSVVLILGPVMWAGAVPAPAPGPATEVVWGWTWVGEDFGLSGMDLVDLDGNGTLEIVCRSER